MEIANNTRTLLVHATKIHGKQELGQENVVQHYIYKILKTAETEDIADMTNLQIALGRIQEALAKDVQEITYNGHG